MSLKEEVDETKKEVQTFYNAYLIIKVAHDRAYDKWIKSRAKFESLDYQLALTDGRFKVVPSPEKRKEKKQPELTMEQIKEIAEKLGIVISIEEPEEEVEGNEEEV